MKKILPRLTACFLTLLLAMTTLNAAPMTNADVIKMARAGIDESVIITSIQNAENGFDTSADGLIALNEAKLSKPIINAIITRASAVAAAAAAAPAKDNANIQGADEIIMIDNGRSQTLRYVKPQTRTAQRGLGWGGVAAYCVLPNPKAGLRATPGATFVVSIPEHASTESHFILASFEVRRNGSREVLIGAGGWASVSTGIPKVRVVAAKLEKAPDQSRAPAQHIIYTLTPSQPLKKGEYAFIADEKCFDFGVD
jgi:hypothetical protein